MNLRRDSEKIARYLCDYYASSIWTKDSFTPLHIAAQLGYSDVAKELAQSKVFNPFQPAYDYPYETPFDILNLQNGF